MNKCQYHIHLLSTYPYGYPYADPHATRTAPHTNTAPTPAHLTAPLRSYTPRPNLSAASPYKPHPHSPNHEETHTHRQITNNVFYFDYLLASTFPSLACTFSYPTCT